MKGVSNIYKKNLMLLCIQLSVILTLFSLFIEYNTQTVVALSIDGEEELVVTHTRNTVKELLKEQKIELSNKDEISHDMEQKISEDVSISINTAKQIEVTIDGETKIYNTTKFNIRDFLNENNIQLSEYDYISVGLDTIIKTNMKIEIKHVKQIKLKTEKGTKSILTHAITVNQLLKEQNIALNKHDRVIPTLDTVIENNMIIHFVKVEHKEELIKEKIKYEIIQKKDPSLLKGEDKVIQKGKNGLLSKQFEVTFENGNEVNRVLINIEKLVEPVNEIRYIGTKETTAAASNLNKIDGKEMYVTATAYTAYCEGCTGISATGINLRDNPNLKIIAVDPNIIPLGSKVWVEGYGVAVAGDTGGAIKGNKIDIFMPSKNEVNNYGRKSVKIKIL